MAGKNQLSLLVLLILLLGYCIVLYCIVLYCIVLYSFASSKAISFIVFLSLKCVQGIVFLRAFSGTSFLHRRGTGESNTCFDWISTFAFALSSFTLKTARETKSIEIHAVKSIKMTLNGDEDNWMKPINKNIQLKREYAQIRSTFAQTHRAYLQTTHATVFWEIKNLNWLVEF